MGILEVLVVAGDKYIFCAQHLTTHFHLICARVQQGCTRKQIKRHAKTTNNTKQQLCNYFNACSISWSLSCGGTPLPKELRRFLDSQVVFVHSNYGPTHLSRHFFAHAYSGSVMDPGVYRLLSQQVLKTVDRVNPSTLADLLWATGKLHHISRHFSKDNNSAIPEVNTNTKQQPLSPTSSSNGTCLGFYG